VALIIQKIFKTFHQVLLSVKSYKDRVDELINKLKEVHGDFYSYEFINYKGSRLPITITCPYHGNFEQRCDVHLKGSGCSTCFRNRQGWGKTEFVNACSKHNNIGTLYIIRCFNDNEEFYKIGITGQTLFQRFGYTDKSTIRMPYNYEIIQEIRNNSELIWDIEQYLHKLYKPFIYKPTIKFAGSNECFKVV
jgi:hypothetical protein